MGGKKIIVIYAFSKIVYLLHYFYMNRRIFIKKMAGVIKYYQLLM